MSKAFRHGQFVWREIMTTDVAASTRFYSETFGWKTATMKMPDGADYVFAKVVQVASVLSNPPGVPSHWLSYIVVETLTAAYDRVKQQGGKVMVERIDVPTVGAIGVIQDNVGAMLGVFEAPAT